MNRAAKRMAEIALIRSTRDLCIGSSPLYICARTLTLLVEDWKRPFSLHERSWIQMIRERKWVFTAGFIVAFAVLLAGSGTSVRSEERRVGKECRSWWSS